MLFAGFGRWTVVFPEPRNAPILLMGAVALLVLLLRGTGFEGAPLLVFLSAPLAPTHDYSD